MRKFIMIVVASLIPVGMWTAGCRQDNRQAVLGLARASELLGDRGRAASLYERAIGMEPEDYPEALELGGRFFGQNGQRGKGHYYLSQYFAVNCSSVRSRPCQRFAF